MSSQEYDSGFGRVEESVLEDDPAKNYKKTRKVFLDRGYENIAEVFEGEPTDVRVLSKVPKKNNTSLRI